MKADKILQIQQLFFDYDGVPMSHEIDKEYLEKIREVVRQ